jgi:hypothetical protein
MGYHDGMTLSAMLGELLDLARPGPPTAQALRDHYAPRAKKITTAGPQLSRPPWAKRVSGGDDVFLELDGDIAGLQLWEDGRGWGAYAELSVTRGTRDDVEALVGPTQSVPRAPGAFGVGDKAAAYIPLGGKTVRVFVEFVKRGPEIACVTVHFQR